MNMQIITIIAAIVALINLWEEALWLGIVAIVLAISYGVHPDEQAQQDATGGFSNTTATRLMLTTIGVMGILVYSFFV